MLRKIAYLATIAFALPAVCLTVVHAQEATKQVQKKGTTKKGDVKGSDLKKTGDRKEAAEETADIDPAARDQVSYGFGIDVGKRFRKDHVNINTEQFIEGLMDGLSGKESRVNPQQLAAAFTAFRTAQFKFLSEKNARDGKVFLQANKSKEGVTTLKSGLQYEILKEGDGPSPTANDIVSAHYHGTLLDGTVFDSSIGNQPGVFPVGRVIRGWNEALQLMKVGDKWKLYVPSNLAYGPDGFGPDIGPNATLVFEMELLSIEKPSSDEKDQGDQKEEK